MKKSISISNKPEISAIYFALLQCGYEYYAIEKEAGLVKRIESFCIANSGSASPFFMEVKQSSCEVYPYWPRAAALETASFFLDCNHKQFKDFDSYRKDIMSAGNISDDERNHAFWSWVINFPAALMNELGSEKFQTYFAWECAWIEQQELIHKNELLRVQKAIDFCSSSFTSPIQEISIILNPIKCAYSADYHIEGNQLFFISGAFEPGSVVHEFLHPIVHPFVVEHKKAILQCNMSNFDIDDSYYLAGDAVGKVNAFEEHMVRKLTDDALMETFPADLEYYLYEILCDPENIPHY